MATHSKYRFKGKTEVLRWNINKNPGMIACAWCSKWQSKNKNGEDTIQIQNGGSGRCCLTQLPASLPWVKQLVRGELGISHLLPPTSNVSTPLRAHLHFANHLCGQSCLVTLPWVLGHHVSDSYDGHSFPSVHSGANLFEESFRDSYSQTSSSPPGPAQTLYLSLPRGPKDRLYIISAQILLILQTVSAFCTAACLISI